MNRRSFLITLASGVVCALLPPGPFLPFVTRGSRRRRAGWNVTCSPQAMASVGTWIAERALELLEPDAWHSWGLWMDPNYSGRAPMVFNGKWWDRAASLAWMRSHPEALWLLGNEPERREQGDEAPPNAAILTGELIDQGASIGVNVQYAAAGTFIGADQPDGLTWLTQYVAELDARGIRRPDKWSVHSYPSHDAPTFRASWARWQGWYGEHGEGKPVIISECCAHNAPDQRSVMDEIAAVLDRGEASAAYWFTAYRLPGDEWPNAALCSLDMTARTATLTDAGRHWKAVQSYGNDTHAG